MSGLKTFGNGRMSLLLCTEFCDHVTSLSPKSCLDRVLRVTANADVFPASQTMR